ncbi:hypothetical protein EMCRGX_G030684 [Ephydatia muelleri]
MCMWRYGMVMGLRSATHDQLMSLLPAGCWGSLLHLTLPSHLRLFTCDSRVCSLCHRAMRYNYPKSASLYG